MNSAMAKAMHNNIGAYSPSATTIDTSCTAQVMCTKKINRPSRLTAHTRSTSALLVGLASLSTFISVLALHILLPIDYTCFFSQLHTAVNSTLHTIYSSAWVLRLAVRYQLTTSFWATAIIYWAVLHLLRRWRWRGSVQHTYLVDFTCFKLSDSMKCNYELSEFITRSNAHGFTIPSMVFQKNIFMRSGLSEETYLPECIMMNPLTPSFEDGRREARDVLFGSVQDLLIRTSIDPQDISILVTNCSLHCPTPSYASMITNHFKLREDCKAFHLGGMGCSASLIACKLASDLLRTEPNQYALVASMENISLNWYPGNDKQMLVTNCLFRVGGSAMLLTNKQSDKARSKYELLHLIRTHTAADAKAYSCVQQREDNKRIIGIALSKNLMGVAADAIRTNIRTLSPLILPSSELLHYIWSLLCRDIFNMKITQYQPDFKLAVNHFCMWYVLAYMEAKGRIKAKHKVWMLGLGSGFKCNSAVWRAIADVPLSRSNPWADCVHRYPAEYS